jgi:hypothetical protein
MELEYSQRRMIQHKDALINEWRAQILNPKSEAETNIPYSDINSNMRLISKLTPIHDKNLYLGSVCLTNVGSNAHIEGCVKLLQQADVVVGMVESTFQLLAMAMDIPVVISKEWEFKIYGGKDYSKCDHIRTDAVVYSDTKDLRKVIEGELANPARKAEKRKNIVLRELGDITTDSDQNILNVIKELMNKNG